MKVASMDLWPGEDAPTLKPKKSDIVLSPQQSAIMDWVDNGTGSAFVEAVAGSGKTTTLIEACQRMTGSVALLAFNKKIADEIKIRLQNVDAGNVRAGTFHSFGLAAWKRKYPKVRVDANGKRKAMLKECCVRDRFWAAVPKLVSLAKQAGAGEFYNDWEDLVDHFDIMSDVDTKGLDAEALDDAVMDLMVVAVECIDWSRDKGSQLIDFDDMIWLPTTTADVPIQAYDWILVDEAQDTNPVRRLLASKMRQAASMTRMIWVGDRAQGIYAFCGADADAVDVIIKDFECESLPLTTTYRCPKAVVRVAQRWVSHIKAHESAPEGVVREVYADEFVLYLLSLKPGDALLCRNTRPLVSLAFRLIRNSIPCHVEGRDIGQGLIKLATRWKVTKTSALITNLEAYRSRETDRLRAREADLAIEALNDRIDTLLVITDGCDTIDDLTTKIRGMFQDSQGGKAKTVVLSTVHKAKGREWDRVFILGFDVYMPSKWAHKDWEIEQETNLLYVAVTRAKRELVMQLGHLGKEGDK